MNVHKNAKLTPAGRAELVRRVLFEDQSVTGVSRSMGVSGRTVRKWVKRYEAEGEVGLLDRSSRPHRSPRRLEPGLVRRIERLRRRKYTGLRIAEELKLAVSTVSLWLRRLGLGRLRCLEPKPEVVRYEKKRPGELLHLDTKKLGRIKGVGHRITGNRRGSGHGLGWEFLHVCIDDATRVAYAEVLPDEKGVTATAFVQRAIAWFEQRDVHVERVMTDNGSCYVSRALRSYACRARGPPHPHSTLPAPDQRQSRALHPYRQERVGIRSRLQDVGRAHPTARRLPQPIQPPTASPRHRQLHTAQPARGPGVNNVLVSYS